MNHDNYEGKSPLFGQKKIVFDDKLMESDEDKGEETNTIKEEKLSKQQMSELVEIIDSIDPIMKEHSNILKDIKETQGTLTIVITGANGYLGTHIVKEALERGYKVVAGVYSNSERQNLKYLNKLKAEHGTKMTIVSFDMCKLDDSENLIKGSNVVIHCAAVSRKQRVHDLINVLYPEIEGVLNILNACVKNKVSRFILATSVSNVAAGKYRKVYNETHWAHPDDCDDFEKSQLFVEKTAMNFVEDKEGQINITVFCSGMLVGPLLKESDTSGSVIFFKNLINNKFEKIMNLKIPLVDVRDLSTIMVASVEKVATFNQRYIVTENLYWLEDLYKLVQQDRKKQLFQKPSLISKVYLKFLSFFDEDLKKIMEFYGKNYKFDNDKMQRDIGIKFRRIDESIGDMILSYEKFGVISYFDGKLQVSHPE